MRYDDDSSAQQLTGLAPITGDLEEISSDQQVLLEDLPPLPLASTEPVTIAPPAHPFEGPAVTVTSTFRTATNYALGLSLFFFAFFGVGIAFGVLLHEGELDSVMGLVKDLVKWVRS